MVVCSGTHLVSFILFSSFLWIVLFPFLPGPTCYHFIYTFNFLDVVPFSFQQLFLTATRVVFNQFNLTVFSKANSLNISSAFVFFFWSSLRCIPCSVFYAFPFSYSNFHRCLLYNICCIPHLLFCKSFHVHTYSYLYLP